MAMIEEVRRQFKDIPQLKAALEIMRKYDSDMSKANEADRKIFDAADGYAEYDKCVEISTQASIKEMVFPGLLALAVPVLVGFGGKLFGIGGPEMLGGLLAGVTTCGVLMAIFQSNAGGAWDNAKKMIEEQGRKGTDAHKAAVVGDTVGDPFKDTSGPSLNILLKLMSVVALVIAPSIALDAADNTEMSQNVKVWIDEDGKKHVISGDDVVHFSDAAKEIEKGVKVNIQENDDGTAKAIVTTTSTENGEAVTKEEIFEGTEEEVNAKIDALKDVDVNIEKGEKVVKKIEEEVEN